MKKQNTEWKCDACLVSREACGDNWRVPDHWAEVEVKIGGMGQEVIHFCQPCWADGRAPIKSTELPLLIRRFFGWVVKKEEGPQA